MKMLPCPDCSNSPCDCLFQVQPFNVEVPVLKAADAAHLLPKRVQRLWTVLVERHPLFS